MLSWRQIHRRVRTICDNLGKERYEDDKIIFIFIRSCGIESVIIRLKTQDHPCVFSSFTRCFLFGTDVYRKGQWVEYLNDLYIKSVAEKKIKDLREWEANRRTRIENFLPIDDAEFFGKTQ